MPGTDGLGRSHTKDENRSQDDENGPADHNLPCGKGLPYEDPRVVHDVLLFPIHRTGSGGNYAASVISQFSTVLFKGLGRYRRPPAALTIHYQRNG
jgi:hypothetical protein